MAGGKLRILWASTGLHVNTGYGKVTRNVTTRLARLGFDVINYNAQLLGGTCYMEGILQLPRGKDTWGSDSIPAYYALYGRNLLVTLWDVWVLHWVKHHALNWLPYVPVDAELDDYTYEINEPLSSPQAIAVVAMSDFGRRQLEKVVRGKKVYVVPHGVDTRLYRPMDRGEARREVGVPSDAFVFGCVAANVGDRKDLPTLLKAFKAFLEDNRDAKEAVLLLWTNVTPAAGSSFDIKRLGMRYGVGERIVVPHVQPPNVYFSEDAMPKVYNCMDWYVTCSRGEGFGLPLIEAMACGVPCIAPRNSAQEELVRGRGILVEPTMRMPTLTVPTHQEYPLVTPERLAEAMGRAYNSCSEGLRERCREFALGYDWDKVVMLWREVLLEVEDML